MAIKLYVDALQAGTYDASLISELSHFLESYDGLTLFKHLTKHDNYLNYFNQTVARFATLASEQSLSEHSKALFGAALKDGFTILVHRLVQDTSNQALSDMIKDPRKSFSFLNEDVLASMLPLLGDFIPEVRIPEMLRHENLLQDVAHIIQPYSTLYDLSQALLKSSFIELAKDALDSKHLLAFAHAIGSININHFSDLTDAQIEEHVYLLRIMYQSANESLKNDIACAMDAFITRYAKNSHILKTILNSVLPLTVDAGVILPQLSARSIDILMKTGVQLIENDQAKIFYHQQLTLPRPKREFILAREEHATEEEWRAACLLAVFFSQPHVKEIKKIVIPLSTLTDYGDSCLKFLITSPKVIFTLKDITPTDFLEVTSILAYFNYYSAGRPSYLLDVSTLIPMFISANKKTCADSLVKAIPPLLLQPNGPLTDNHNYNNPYLFNIDVDKNTECIKKLQQTLSEPTAPSFLWILFGNVHAGVSEYTYDVYLYKDHIEAGYFTRSGCGNVKLLKEHMPSITDHNAATSKTAIILGMPSTQINPTPTLTHACTSNNNMEFS